MRQRMEPRTLLDFMGVAERLKCNMRHSRTAENRRESVAEHTYRLCVFTWLVKEEFPDCDMDKVMRMSLFHDLGEAVTGDIPAFVKTDSDREVEESAISNVTAMLPERERKELDALFDELEKADDFDMAVHDLIKEYATEHQRIVFNGNGYSDEWVKEAERRGLPNIKTMVESIECLTYDNAVEMFEKFDVFSRAELESRAEIKYEAYSKAINIEARSMIDIASKHIIPAVIQYVTSLANSINQVKQASAAAYTGVQEELLVQSADLLKDTKEALRALETVVAEVPETEGKEQAFFFMQKVVPAMEALRKPVDELEMIVNKNMWPMPSYGDLLFEV